MSQGTLEPEVLAGSRPKRNTNKRDYVSFAGHAPGEAGKDDIDKPPKRPKPASTEKRRAKSTGLELEKEKTIHARLFALGGQVKVPDKVTALPKVTGHKSGLFEKIAGNYEKYLHVETFGGRFRSKFPNMDELFATAATREFFTGYFETDPLEKAPDELARVGTLWENLSAYGRFPTHVIGFATALGVMQHQSAGAKSVFARWQDTSSEHNFLDRERKWVALEEGEAAAGLDDATMDSVLRAMLRAAAVFTLNYMAAPASASDILPYGLRTKTLLWNDPAILEWLGERERIKHLAIALGADVEDDDPDEDGRGRAERPWNEPGKNQRSVSRSRLKKLPDGTFELYPYDPAAAVAHPLAALPAAPFPPPAAPSVADLLPPAAPSTPDLPPGPEIPAPDPINQAAQVQPTLMDLADLLELI